MASAKEDELWVFELSLVESGDASRRKTREPRFDNAMGWC